jgi:hypothetical protein
MAGNKGGKETDMISNKQLDRWLKEQKLSLVLCDVTFPGELPAFHPELAGLGKGHYADGGVWSCVYWEERLVVAHFEILGGTHPKMLGPDPFLIHELVHAAMPLPPNLCVEARSWMFGAEMKIAGAWGLTAVWEYAMRGLEVDWEELPTHPRKVPRALQGLSPTTPWGSLTVEARALWREAWWELAKQEGVLREGRLRLPTHLAQLREGKSPVPRGLHWALPPNQGQGWVGYHQGKQVRTASLGAFQKMEGVRVR